MKESFPDLIRLPGMEILCRIGCDRDETDQPQPLLLKMDVGLDLTASALDDELGSTLDYTLLVDRIRQVSSESSFRLLESLCWQLMRAVFDFPGVDRVSVSLEKKRLPLGEDVGPVVIRMCRRREEMS